MCTQLHIKCSVFKFNVSQNAITLPRYLYLTYPPFELNDVRTTGPRITLEPDENSEKNIPKFINKLLGNFISILR